MNDKTVKTYSDNELEYAATARCKCGAGMAHPLDTHEAIKLSAWVCSDVLKGTASGAGHESLPFAFWKVREETSINNAGNLTTRPPGTKAMTQGRARCPACGHAWQSEPYKAGGLSHHWFGGACPECAYAVGGNGVYSSGQGAPIEQRYTTVVVEDKNDG